MFEYKIGDRVVIVDYEDALRRDEFPKFVLDMRRYCGKEVTIRDISIECGEKILRFDEIGFVWREDWVMPLLKIDTDNFEKFLMED